MKDFYVYLAVIVGGAAVLAIELLGTRLIAPFYGVSLYLWSALISVTLAALSCGYLIGGYWADRGAKLSRFCAIIGVAGLWIAIIPFLRIPVLAAAGAIGLRAGVLLAAFLLFFPPLTLLGMVSPYAIRLKASSLDVVGRTAGNLYALSTIASVIAALVTGFVLIPNVNMYWLVFSIGLVLVITSIIGFANGRKSKLASISTFVCILLVVLATFALPSQRPNPEQGVLAVRQSAYAELRVVDREDARYLLIDGGTHSAVDTASWSTTFPYVNVLDFSRRFFKQPGDMLTIGLGGGSVAKSFARNRWNVDAVEIDPVVTELAHEFFGFKDSDAKVYEADGRQFLMTNGKTYDVIVVDAFGSSFIPFHLVTREAFGLVKSRLKSDGVVAMNIWSIGWRDEMVNSLAATLRQQFRHVLALPIAEPPDQFGNLVLMASDRELVPESEPPVPLDRFSAEYDQAHAWDNRFEPDTKGALVLTDAHNPIDIWAERVNLAARTKLRETVDKQGIAW